MENCLLFDPIHDFSVLLKIGSNPADINLFWSYTEKNTLEIIMLLVDVKNGVRNEYRKSRYACSKSAN